MVRIGLMIEGQNGLTWERWQNVLQAAEEGGFDSVFRSDHFTNPRGPDKPALELWPSLTYAASHTTRIQFGPLVTPVTFRLPAITVKDAAAVHDLSGGRLVLGIGAGWQEREHVDWGIPFPNVSIRYGMLREYLEITCHLFRSDERLTLEGTYYQFHDALLLPRPEPAGGPPILVGGNGERRTMPLAARFANEWNGLFVPPARYKELTDRLDTLLRDLGRDPKDVIRSAMLGTLLARSRTAYEDAIAQRGWSGEEATQKGLVVGTPDMWIEQIRAYADAGVERMMLQWLDLDDIEGIRTVAREVLPAFGQG